MNLDDFVLKWAINTVTVCFGTSFRGGILGNAEVAHAGVTGGCLIAGLLMPVHLYTQLP